MPVITTNLYLTCTLLHHFHWPLSALAEKICRRLESCLGELNYFGEFVFKKKCKNLCLDIYELVNFKHDMLQDCQFHTQPSFKVKRHEDAKILLIVIMIAIIIITFKGTIRFLTISLLHRELSPTRMLKWPGRYHVQITCNTSSTYHMQHVDLRATWYDRTAQLLGSAFHIFGTVLVIHASLMILTSFFFFFCTCLLFKEDSCKSMFNMQIWMVCFCFVFFFIYACIPVRILFVNATW